MKKILDLFGSNVRVIVAWIAAFALGVLAVEDRFRLPMVHALKLSTESNARLYAQLLLMLVVLALGFGILLRAVVSFVKGAPNGDAFASFGVLIALVYSGALFAGSLSDPSKMAHVQFEWAAWPLAMLITLDSLGFCRDDSISDKGATGSKLAKERDIYEIGMLVFVVVLAVVCMLCHQSTEFIVRVVVATLTTASMGVWGLFTGIFKRATREGNRFGFRVRDMEAMGLLAKTGEVIFDKTGTLTGNNPKVATILPMGKATREDVLSVAAQAEGGNTHPYAVAITEAYENLRRTVKDDLLGDVIPAEDVNGELTIRSGLGVRLEKDGEILLVGNRRFMTQYEIELTIPEELAEQMIRNGQTLIYVAKNETLIGVLGIIDSLEPQVSKSVEEIKGMGIKTRMITGDDQRIADFVGRVTGVDEAIGQVFPEEKAELVKKAAADGSVVMMAGSIASSATAILAAPVGFAIGEIPEDLEREAEVTTESGNIFQIRQSLSLSRKVMGKIRSLKLAVCIFQAVAILLSCGLLYVLFGWLVSPMIMAIITLAFRVWAGWYARA